MSAITGIDCYSAVSTAQLGVLKQNAIRSIGRYIGNKTHGWPKAMTPNESKQYIDAGLSIASIYESAPTHREHFTYDNGLAEARDAVTDAKWLSQPSGSAIYFPVDYPAQQADFPAIEQYYRGLRKNIGDYKLGGYGSFAVIEFLHSKGLCDYYWQTCAWSDGKVSQHADIYQSECDVARYGMHVDIDEIRHECGMWPKEVVTMSYPTIKAQVNGHDFPAIVVNGVTYVVWGALEFLNTPHTYKGNGLMNVNGEDIQGVVQGGDTYLPWACLAKGVEAKPIDGGWNFVVAQPEHAPAPTPAPSSKVAITVIFDSAEHADDAVAELAKLAGVVETYKGV